MHGMYHVQAVYIHIITCVIHIRRDIWKENQQERKREERRTRLRPKICVFCVFVDLNICFVTVLSPSISAIIVVALLFLFSGVGGGIIIVVVGIVRFIIVMICCVSTQK